MNETGISIQKTATLNGYKNRTGSRTYNVLSLKIASDAESPNDEFIKRLKTLVLTLPM